MDALLEKLNYSRGPIVVLDAPEDLRATLDAWASIAGLAESPPADATFVIGFAKMRASVAPLVAQVVPSLTEDAVFWIAYPKKSSKRYKSDLSRDDSWEALGRNGFEPVRQVAIDEDWSALRFRRVEHIKTMRRNTSMTLSEEGRRRTAGENKPS